jgi:hypothetical protein
VPVRNCKQTQLLSNVRHDGPTSRKCPVGIRFCHGPDAEPVSVRDHDQALRTLANRLVGILQGCLRTHTLYNEHLAWHNELNKLSPAA